MNSPRQGENRESLTFSPGSMSTPTELQSRTGGGFGEESGRPWHDPSSDRSTRAAINENIKRLLRARKTATTTADFQAKLPQMALRLERELYNQANSFAEYSDLRTLKHRLQVLANSMANPRASLPSGDVVLSNGQAAPFPMRPLHIPPSSAPLTAAATPAASSASVLTTCPDWQFINTSQVDSSLSSQPPAAIQPASDLIESRRQQVIRQQQQMLLLLRHGSKCTHDSDCPVTPHCAGMKLLWRHIITCRNPDCKMSRCVSSRYVLSHYSKCKDERCPVCAPVREAIRRNHEKASRNFENKCCCPD